MSHLVNHFFCAAQSYRSGDLEYHIFHHFPYDLAYFQPQCECEQHWFVLCYSKCPGYNAGSDVLTYIPLSLFCCKYYIWDIVIY